MRMLRAMAVLLAGMTSLAGAADVSEDVSDSIFGGFYVRGDAGWSFLEWDEGEDGGAMTGGLGIGYQWNDFLRADARADWSGPYDTGSVDLEATTLTGNAYIDVPLTSNLTPYVGAGLGWGWVESDDGGDDSGLAYSLMLGSAFTITPGIELDAGYRYRGISIDDEDTTDHSVTGGIRFKF